MPDSIYETVIRTLEEDEVPFLVDTRTGMIAILVPSPRGGPLLIEVLTVDEQQEAFFRCGVAPVPQTRRAELLELLNDLNVGLKPFNRWLLAGEVAGVQVGCELVEAAEPQTLIRIAFGRILHALEFGAKRVLDAVEHGYSPEADAVAGATRITGGKSAAAE
jgi:hypothetical protein